MKTFKFFRGTPPNPYEALTLRWVGIEVDGYKFRIQTHHSPYQINRQMQHIYGGYMRMWDDGMNRDRLLELLRGRFADAINVIDHDELVRNGW